MKGTREKAEGMTAEKRTRDWLAHLVFVFPAGFATGGVGLIFWPNYNAELWWALFLGAGAISLLLGLIAAMMS